MHIADENSREEFLSGVSSAGYSVRRPSAPGQTVIEEPQPRATRRRLRALVPYEFNADDGFLLEEEELEGSHGSTVAPLELFEVSEEWELGDAYDANEMARQRDILGVSEAEFIATHYPYRVPFEAAPTYTVTPREGELLVEQQLDEESTARGVPIAHPPAYRREVSSLFLLLLFPSLVFPLLLSPSLTSFRNEFIFSFILQNKD